MTLFAKVTYKAWRGIALPELDLSEEHLACFSTQIQAD